MYNLYNVTCMYQVLSLDIGQPTGFSYLRKIISHALTMPSLPIVFFCMGLRPHEISSFSISMSIGIAVI